MKNHPATRILALAVLFLVSILFEAYSSFSAPEQQQNYTGTFTMSSGDVTLTLVLQQDQAGNVTGTLKSSNGSTFTLEGMVSEGVANGVCRMDEGGLYFEAYLDGNELSLGLIEPDQFNMPDYDKAQYLVLTRSSGARPDGAGGMSALDRLTQSPAQQQSDMMSYSGSVKNQSQFQFNSYTRLKEVSSRIYRVRIKTVQSSVGS